MAEDSTRRLHHGALPNSRQPPMPSLRPGTQVAGYVVETRLGAGGYGTVYRARGGESIVALKLLPLESSGGWEEREVDVLRRLRHPHVVRLLGYIDWPENEPHFRALVMEYVDGLPLDEWVRRHNPSALQVVELLLPLLEALAAVHAAGVVHRDVKPSNILVRASNGQPVLVDFGAGAYTGAPPLTSLLPPGTPEYRSPEVWDFFRRHVGEGGTRYQPGPSDDLWAMGVLLYWLLTDRLPFGGGDLLTIGRTVLTEDPPPPHTLNARAPEALGRVCLRLLAKAREDRYAGAEEVHTALATLKAGADDTWCVPLFGSHDPLPPTARRPEGQDRRSGVRRMAQRWPWRSRGAGGDGTASAPTSPPRIRPGLVLALAGVVVACLALASGSWPRPSQGEASSQVKQPTLLAMSPAAVPMPWETFFQEVVPPRKPPESGGDAAPGGVGPPAPAVNDRPREKDMREKKQTTSSPREETQPRKARSGTALALATATTLACIGCAPPSALQQAFIKAVPKGKTAEGSLKHEWLECQPESVESMKKAGIPVGSTHEGFWGEELDMVAADQIHLRRTEIASLRESKYPEGISFVLGFLGSPWGSRADAEYKFGGLILIKPENERIYARITTLYHPGKPHTMEAVHFPVCMEIWHDGKLGAPNLGPSTNPKYRKALSAPSRIELRAVDQFQ